jgi:hypothetical protein
MKRKITLVLILSFVAVFILAAPATTTVYVTKTGEKYHLSTCSSLRKSNIQTTLGEAIAQGYEPCKICEPPHLDQATE